MCARVAEPAGPVRVVSPRDVLYPVYAATHGPEAYFESGRGQVEAIEGFLTRYAGRRVVELRCLGDYACHYGRLLRWLRARAPEATIIAYDIDPEALEFCTLHFEAVPVRTDWSMSTVGPAPNAHELLICSSLLTHTDERFARRALAGWARMLAPGGLLVFTYLGPDLARSWVAGKLPYYGPCGPEEGDRILADLARDGHAFASQVTPHSARGEYGVGFLTDARVRALVADSGLELRELVSTARNVFGQDLAVVTRGGGMG